jgi:hypothetical protein
VHIQNGDHRGSMETVSRVDTFSKFCVIVFDVVSKCESCAVEMTR